MEAAGVEGVASLTVRQKSGVTRPDPASRGQRCGRSRLVPAKRPSGAVSMATVEASIARRGVTRFPDRHGRGPPGLAGVKVTPTGRSAIDLDPCQAWWLVGGVGTKGVSWFRRPAGRRTKGGCEEGDRPRSWTDPPQLCASGRPSRLCEQARFYTPTRRLEARSHPRRAAGGQCDRPKLGGPLARPRGRA